MPEKSRITRKKAEESKPTTKDKELPNVRYVQLLLYAYRTWKLINFVNSSYFLSLDFSLNV